MKSLGIKALIIDINFCQRSPTSIDVLDFVIKDKTRYDAFYHTELGSLLVSLGIKTLIISGAETNLCCEATARSEYNSKELWREVNLLYIELIGIVLQYTWILKFKCESRCKM